MAREVNLSSREWCDLVFDGKNKDFGAYIIRTESAKRHNLAVLWALIGAVAVAALSLGLMKANQYLEKRRLAASFASPRGPVSNAIPPVNDPASSFADSTPNLPDAFSRT